MTGLDLEVTLEMKLSRLLSLANKRFRSGRSQEDLDEVQRLRTEAQGVQDALDALRAGHPQVATAPTESASPAIPTGRMAGSQDLRGPAP